MRSAISMPSSIITARRTWSSRRDISSSSAVAVRSMNASETEVPTWMPQSSSGLAQTLQRGDFAVEVGLVAKCGEVGQVPAALHQVTVRWRRISPTMPTL